MPPVRRRAWPRLLVARRPAALLGLAAALLLAVFVAGYALGGRGGGFPATSKLAMHGLGAAASARAMIAVARRDARGNWPLLLRVRGLRKLPPGGWYTLYLTKNGKPDDSCGSFSADRGLTIVRLNAPYDLRRYDGWVVVANLPGRPSSQPVVLTT